MKFGALSIAVIVFLAGPVGAQDANGVGPPAPRRELSEAQRLQAENFQLRVEIAQLRATVADRENRLRSIELSAEQERLVEEFRRTLGVEATDRFDWTTLTFAPIEKKPGGTS